MGWISQFTNWVTPYFLNPAFVLPGLLCILGPIIIHLINRRRFRTVHFAAMEFLLESHQRNKRRVLIEQIILLLLRCLLVAGIAFLISRLLLKPDQASVFRSSKTLHVVLLDDSASMQNSWGTTNAFEKAKAVVQRLVEEGSRRAGQQQLTLIRLSDYQQQVFEKRQIGDDFLEEVEAKLNSLKCTNKSLSLEKGLQECRRYLDEDKISVKRLHVISDFRSADWSQKSALAEEIKLLNDQNVPTNLVRTVPDSHNNLAITTLSSVSEEAIVGTSLRFTVELTNFGTQSAEEIELTVLKDGKPVNVIQNEVTVEHLIVPKIESGATQPAEVIFELNFTKPGWHQIQVSIPTDTDPLVLDNVRSTTIKVRDAINLLVIDGDPEAWGATFFKIAFTALDRVIPVNKSIDALRKENLNKYSVIYLFDIGDIPLDALKPLQEYVKSGGGLVWYMGAGVRPEFYNEHLYESGGKGIFPVRLEAKQVKLPAQLISIEGSGSNKIPDLAFANLNHPITKPVFGGKDNPHAKVIEIKEYFPVRKEWTEEGETVKWISNDQQRNDGVTTLLRMRNGEPLAFEHLYGEGRVVTVLTTLGGQWNNWILTPSAFVPFQLEVQSFVSKRFQQAKPKLVGDEIQQVINTAIYQETVSVMVPESNRPLSFKATPLSESDNAVNSTSEPNTDGTSASVAKANEKADPTETSLQAITQFSETDVPGVYILKAPSREEGEAELEVQYAVNPNTDQSDLHLLDTRELNQKFESLPLVQVHEPERFEWLERRDSDQDVRYLLIAILVGLLILEQFMAYRLSYHPDKKRTV